MCMCTYDVNLISFQRVCVCVCMCFESLCFVEVTRVPLYGVPFQTVSGNELKQSKHPS